MKNLDMYFATLENDEELLEAIHGKINNYYQFLEDNNLFSLWNTAYRAYYGTNLASKSCRLQFDSAELSKGGTRGEITYLKINHFRNLLTHILQLTTANKPSLSCRSNNTDYDSQCQAILGNGLLDYYFREKRVMKHSRRAVETSIIFGESFIHSPWNPNGGNKYEVTEDGKIVYEGDLQFEVLNPLCVARDVNLKEEDDHNWYVIKSRINKWDLVSEYPKFKDDILSGSTKTYGYELLESFDFINSQSLSQNESNSDLVVVWTFYHKPTVSVPKGRLVRFTGEAKLVDTGLPYEKTPIARVTPTPLINTIFGWSPAFDLLAPQQAMDILNATIITNQATFGVQNIWTKINDPVTVTTLSSGLKNFQSDEPPQPVQLTRTAAETYNYRAALSNDMEILSGINSVVRGQPEASLKSGAALALVVSQAVQFASLLEASYQELVEDVGYSIISTLRDFSRTERVASIVGKANRSYVRKFNSGDLSAISRVSMEAVNPLSKTISGRLELAEKLSERNLIDNADEYITVLQTGTLDPLIEGKQASVLNIRAENETLRQGRPVRALLTDMHQNHITEHVSILSTPEARSDERFASNVLAHVQEHVNLWRTADPAILFVTGQQPPPQDDKTSPTAAASPSGIPNTAPIAGNAPSIPMDADMPSMPNMPNMPANSDENSQEAYNNYSQMKGNV